VTRVAVIGLGTMGLPMARNLLAAGHEVVCCDVDADRAAALGAPVARSAAEAAASAEVTIASLPSPAAVEAVALGEDGVCAGAAAGSLFADMSTGPPELARAIAAALEPAGVDVLDAPVSGGVAGARARTLAVMAAGPAPVFERVKPLLELFGGNVFHVGTSPGQGQVAKLLNNLLSASALAITSEALTLAVTAGLDPATLIDVFNAGTGRNSATATKFPDQVLTGRFASGFRLELMAKDLELCLAEAREKGLSLQLGELVQRLWTQAAAEADPSADHTEIVRFFERLSGVAVAPTDASGR
jgi:3-hydroxyisobutyrate dehydrogenase-like beta-hydroxyacid dehydrogenase